MVNAQSNLRSWKKVGEDGKETVPCESQKNCDSQGRKVLFQTISKKVWKGEEGAA